MNLFNEDGIWGRTFNFLGQLIALNLLWMVCSIPVITVGTSTTALYYCVLKLKKDGDCSIWKQYWKSFRQNFIQSTIIWIGILVIALCLWMEWRAASVASGGLGTIITYIVGAMTVLLVIVALYIFPIVAAFENKISKLLTHVVYFGTKNIGYVIVIAIITILPMYFTLLDTEMFPILLFVWLTCGFSLTAYANANFFWKLFQPFFPSDKKQNQEVQ